MLVFLPVNERGEQEVIITSGEPVVSGIRAQLYLC